MVCFTLVVNKDRLVGLEKQQQFDLRKQKQEKQERLRKYGKNTNFTPDEL